MYSLSHLKYQIFGKVQKVFFRKNTQAYAEKIGVVGWVQNTASGTVIGQAQGTTEQIEKMKTWLSTVGSPKCRIDDAKFQQQPIQSLKFKQFDVIK